MVLAGQLFEPIVADRGRTAVKLNHIDRRLGPIGTADAQELCSRETRILTIGLVARAEIIRQALRDRLCSNQPRVSAESSLPQEGSWTGQNPVVNQGYRKEAP